MRVRKVRSLSVLRDRPITEVSKLMTTAPCWIPFRIQFSGNRLQTISLFSVLLFLALTSIPAAASTLIVPAGGDFQAALNAANLGDTIVLQAGATYMPAVDSFFLPAKSLGTGTDADYITIRTSNLAGIAPDGQRIDPALHGSSLARLVGKTGYAVVTANAGAHHYKFIGIEITTTGNTSVYTPDLVNLGAYFTRQQRLDTNHIFFDRVFIHAAEISASNLFPTTLERTSGRGIGAGITELWVVNSYIAGFCGKYPSATPNAGQMIDAYGIYSDTGPGPIHIVNNYIEAQFNNIFIGGAGMTTPNTGTVSNGTVSSATLSNVNNLAVGDLIALPYAACNPTNTGNSRVKPWETGKVTSINGNNITFSIVQAQNSCVPAAPDNGGTARWKGDLIHDLEVRRNTLNKPDVWNSFSYPKAWIEIKQLRNGVIDGNDMYSGIGTAIALTARNEDGASPWSTVENVTISNNRIRGYKWGFSLLMTDNEQPTMMGGNIAIRNNLFYQPKPVTGSAANFLQMVAGHDISAEHNTLVQPGSPVVDDLPTPNFIFRNNIVANYQYGMQCTISPYTLSTCWSNLVMLGNVIIDTRWDKGEGPLSIRYPRGNYYVNSSNEIGFVNMDNGDYRLAPSSKVRGKASDGQDPGCDIPELMKALNGNQ